MADPRPRRHALCVRPTLNPDAPLFLRTISDEWIEALALHCHVTTIEHDFDFSAVCDRVRPDFVIYDAVHWVRPTRIKVTNARAHPHIPRAFFFNCDPHDPMRPQVMELLHHYGIDTVFCGVEHLQQMPELDQLDCFVLPLFVDTEVFRDYGVERNIAVSVFGGHLFPSFYHWRARLLNEIQHIIPTLVYPHPGYGNGEPSPFEVRGEQYARLLSASRFSVADTTRLDYVVRKHLEIPATGAILIAPDSDVLKALGFADMENCILGEGQALYQKIAVVAGDAASCERISAAGHDLVHCRYTRRNWTHMVDWFECRSACPPGHVTQQEAVFGHFRNVPLTPDVVPIAGLKLANSPLSAVLGEAAAAIRDGGNLDEAKARLHEVCGWIGHIEEPRFLLGVIAMLEGNLDEGLKLIGRHAFMKDGDKIGLGQIDPCQLAWLLLIGAITGDAEFCAMLIERARRTPHVSVRRAMWLLSGASHTADFGAEGLMSAQPGDWPSVHWGGQDSFPQWLGLLARLFEANRAAGLADHMRMIAAAFTPDEDAGEETPVTVGAGRAA
ncbi:hypothetical protein [Erythrobacter sp. WG]|uniref:hypothetical protein n=1 Tax=Erythrobacter sp. WG TaxID=2985510 RepID=UPI00227053AB|nr:hypothetical protein [Erythrobacter sp. WG]MCX9148592.1 hypothetical protein [Erythrobacter sp. WG]